MDVFCEALLWLATYCINFVDEDNTWSILLSLSEHVSYTRSTNTYEHLHEIRT